MAGPDDTPPNFLKLFHNICSAGKVCEPSQQQLGDLEFLCKWGSQVTRVWFNVASRVQPRRLIDCWNSNLQLVINTLLIAYWFPYSYSLLTHYSVFTTHYLLFTEYVRFGPLLTYSWYKSSSVIQQEHWCTGIHFYLRAAHEGGYLFTSRHPISGSGTFYKMRRILNPF